MTNNASNWPKTSAITQALRAQASQLLPVLTAMLSTLEYKVISHQRISQQRNSNTTSYYGLTGAQHPQFGSVMIKWELSPDTNPDAANHNAFNDNAPNHNVSNDSRFNLSHDVAVLHDLKQSQSTKAQNNTTPILAIAPPILAYDTLRTKISEQNQQFTMLVMPYYSMGSLAHYLHQPLTDTQKHQLIVRVAHLIADLHSSGWLHNDIKPSNILLDDFLVNNADYSSITPRCLLTDFALAERLGQDFNDCVDQKCATNTAGTPAYLAPERWQAHAASQQSDIYAFGIMVYEILVGARPFKLAAQSNDPLKEWAIQHCQKPIPVLPAEYSHYQQVINKAFAKRVEKRYKSMEAVWRDLEGF
ncbi:serine/threonine-protein kinase [Psychrobacter sp. PL15]|uniref:protein kinase domain-containing protein n=1 Tax=Psychrobacter sp. PL15 TaxID=3071719 RepID=UPI002DFD0B19|nr:serine/threonine-protein kinase [Psychrobacter sp. PL15]